MGVGEGRGLLGTCRASSQDGTNSVWSGRTQNTDLFLKYSASVSVDRETILMYTCF